MHLSSGLFDLQVNGYAGIDFNDPGITANNLDKALEAMRKRGVMACLPTFITATREELLARMGAVDAAIAGSRWGREMIPGYHLEGPFLNDGPGYRGCHPHEVMCDPDIEMVAHLEQSLSLPIMLLTLAPERQGGMEAVKRFAQQGKVVAIGHSAVDLDGVAEASCAGASLSTHLGNGLPKLVPKLDNPLLAQLAAPALRSCLIADGIHVLPASLKALVTIKGIENCILVTDAVAPADAPAGSYSLGHIPINSDDHGRVTREGTDGLAGSSLCLDQAVRNLVQWDIADFDAAARMASTIPLNAMTRALEHAGKNLNLGKVHWNDQLEICDVAA